MNPCPDCASRSDSFFRSQCEGCLERALANLAAEFRAAEEWPGVDIDAAHRIYQSNEGVKDGKEQR